MPKQKIIQTSRNKSQNVDSSNDITDRTKFYSTCIQFCCLIGIALSMYSYYVEVSKEKDEHFSAMCDISEHVSCSKVFMSEYGKGFGVIGKLLGDDSVFNQPNGIFGLFFYALVFTLSIPYFFSNICFARFQLLLNVASLFLSVWLAYILYFVLHDFCIVCILTYIVNIANTIFSYLQLRKLYKLNRENASKLKLN